MCLLAIPRISAWTIRKNPEKHFGHWSTSIQALPLLPCQFGSTECYGLCKTAANLPDAAQQSRLFRLCRVWLRPGLTGMLVRCMLSGTRFVVSAPKRKRKHSPTRLPDRLGYRLHRECNAVPERTFVSAIIVAVHHPPRGGCPIGWLSAPRYGRTQIGATYYGVLRRELPAIRQISTSV